MPNEAWCPSTAVREILVKPGKHEWQLLLNFNNTLIWLAGNRVSEQEQRLWNNDNSLLERKLALYQYLLYNAIMLQQTEELIVVPYGLLREHLESTTEYFDETAFNAAAESMTNDILPYLNHTTELTRG